jgi:hypothetical protein
VPCPRGFFVVPANAGTQRYWIPAFAGMTDVVGTLQGHSTLCPYETSNALGYFFAASICGSSFFISPL